MQQIEFKTSRRSIGRIDLAQGQELMVGSDQSGPLCIAGPAVLPQHARFVCRDESVWIEPLGAAPLLLNGTPVEQAMPVKDGDWLAFGETLIQIRLPDATPAAHPPTPPAHAAHPTGEIIVGRLPGCGLPIDSPLISREHARLVLAADGVWLEDLKSTNGTWINGQRITKPVALQPGDRVSFASFVFLFSGTALEPVEAGNRVRIAARGLTKTVMDRATGQPRHLLSQIDLVIEPGEFVVIFGTSGSGKSTLMDALNGRRPASSGQVAYNGVDLYRSFNLFRSGIGYVPQQDIVHRKIRMRNALRYTARLRLPPDTTPREIDANIERVLERVGMADKADLAVDTPEPLSGGQLKRVSLAVELVANPHVLFLDEATSGLDAGTDNEDDSSLRRSGRRRQDRGLCHPHPRKHRCLSSGRPATSRPSGLLRPASTGGGPFRRGAAGGCLRAAGIRRCRRMARPFSPLRALRALCARASACQRQTSHVIN